MLTPWFASDDEPPPAEPLLLDPLSLLPAAVELDENVPIVPVVAVAPVVPVVPVVAVAPVVEEASVPEVVPLLVPVLPFVDELALLPAMAWETEANVVPLVLARLALLTGCGAAVVLTTGTPARFAGATVAFARGTVGVTTALPAAVDVPAPLPPAPPLPPVALADEDDAEPVPPVGLLAVVPLYATWIGKLATD